MPRMCALREPPCGRRTAAAAASCSWSCRVAVLVELRPVLCSCSRVFCCGGARCRVMLVCAACLCGAPHSACAALFVRCGWCGRCLLRAPCSATADCPFARECSRELLCAQELQVVRPQGERPLRSSTRRVVGGEAGLPEWPASRAPMDAQARPCVHTNEQMALNCDINRLHRGS